MGNDRVVYILEQELPSVSVCTAVFSLEFLFQERCTHHSSCQCGCHQVSQPECCVYVCVHLLKVSEMHFRSIAGSHYCSYSCRAVG